VREPNRCRVLETGTYRTQLEAFALLNISSQLCAEHGIGADGSYEGSGLGFRDRKDVFFYQVDEHRYVPRALMLDLEPRVINTIQNSEQRQLFSQDNIFVSSQGGGAGNNWASGYNQAEQSQVSSQQPLTIKFVLTRLNRKRSSK